MIYTVNDNKNYSFGKRDAEQFFLRISKIEKRRIEKENDLYSKIASSKTFILVTIESADVIEILFEYSDEHIPLFSESIRIFETN